MTNVHESAKGARDTIDNICRGTRKCVCGIKLKETGSFDIGDATALRTVSAVDSGTGVGTRLEYTGIFRNRLKDWI